MNKIKALVVDDDSVDSDLYDGLYSIARQPQEEQQKEAMWKGLIENTLKHWEAKLIVGIDYLSSIGSIAPFIGLFGTVWGIMNSFQAIAVSNSTSIAVVAPGISEALFATAVGLFVAIPATIATNLFSSKIDSMLKESELFAFFVMERLRKEV